MHQESVQKRKAVFEISTEMIGDFKNGFAFLSNFFIDHSYIHGFQNISYRRQQNILSGLFFCRKFYLILKRENIGTQIISQVSSSE
jgi:hypothetical protein